MIKCNNLTQVLVALKTKKDMIQFLSDRKRSIQAALRENPSTELAIELELVNALEEEFQKDA